VADYRVYVLRNEQARRYIGLSEDPHLRLQQHNSGLSQWTRHRAPCKLVWQSAPLSLSEARKLEIRFKRQGGGKGFYTITGLPFPDGS
jgi:predicted GIY-YIG superfamily endonuclease